LEVILDSFLLFLRLVPDIVDLLLDMLLVVLQVFIVEEVTCVGLSIKVLLSLTSILIIVVGQLIVVQFSD
jgi:hypothetical protein